MTRLSRQQFVAPRRGFAASLVLGLTVLTATQASAADDANAPIQRPEALGTPDSASGASPDTAAPASPDASPGGPAAGDATATPAPADGPPGDPEAVPAPPAEGGPPAGGDNLSENPDPGSAPAEGAPDEVAASPPAVEPVPASLLAGNEDEEEALPPPQRGPTRTQVEDDAAYDAAVRSAYAAQYRPAENPGRLNIAVRGLFANAGGNEKVGGRMGGIQADVGQSWNRFGYALTASVWGGRVYLNDRVAEMNSLLGLGPTLNLGRLALVGRGFLDLRAGYDVYYGIVNQRRDAPTVVAPQSGGNVVLEQTENLLPHGPRAQLNLGLLGGNNYRKHFHGFGVSMGYQGLVGSLRGDLPFTHMLTIGLSYWMG